MRKTRQKRAVKLSKFASDGQPPLAFQKLRYVPTLSMKDVSRATGLSMSMLSKVFNGTRTPSTRAAKRLAFELGTTVDRLLHVLDECAGERAAKEEVTAEQPA